MRKKPAKIMSDQFDWKPTRETYSFLWAAWDVAAAKRIIIAKPREVINIKLSALKHYVERPAPDAKTINLGHRIHWDKIDNGEINLNFPLIGVTLKEGPWIIDGWHRMALGFEQGQEIFQVVLLNQKESDRVRQ